jgi:hypothetical protein
VPAISSAWIVIPPEGMSPLPAMAVMTSCDPAVV